MNAPPEELKPLPMDKDTPLDLNQARNAIRIARWAHADQDAEDSFAKAEKLLKEAEAYKARKAGTKPVAMTAREAAQTAEDARLIALRAPGRTAARAGAPGCGGSRSRSESASRPRQSTVCRRFPPEDSGRTGTETRSGTPGASRGGTRSSTSAGRSDRAQAEVARERALREQAAAEQARQAAARAEAERAAAQAMAEAERARALNEQAAAEQARQAAARAEREKSELRSNLIQQLNLVLDTRDTERGLVINISDVLFDIGQYTLKPTAREKLARVSGIVLAHPGLRLEAEGHTDSIGSDEFNQQLSEKRALAVRDFLVGQGIADHIVRRSRVSERPCPWHPMIRRRDGSEIAALSWSLQGTSSVFPLQRILRVPDWTLRIDSNLRIEV